MIFSRNNIITLIILLISTSQLFGIGLKITLSNTTSRELLIVLTENDYKRTFQWIKPNTSITFNISNPSTTDKVPFKDLTYSDGECKFHIQNNCGKDLINKDTGLISDKDQEKMYRMAIFSWSLIQLTKWDGVQQLTMPSEFLKGLESLRVTLTESDQINFMTKSKEIVGSVEKNK